MIHVQIKQKEIKKNCIWSMELRRKDAIEKIYVLI
jgi:hypothetical protein